MHAASGICGIEKQDGAQKDRDGCVCRCRQGQDEEEDCHSDQDYEPAGKAFPVEHEDESYIDEGRSGLALSEDHEHRKSDQTCCHEEVLDIAYLIVASAHYEGQHQRGRDLRDLSRLELDRTEFEP